MNEEMEKIAEYERGNRSDGQGEKNPGRNFLDDYRRSGPVPDADRKEGSRRHVRNWGGVDFERVKTGGPEWDKEWQGRRAGGPKGCVDMTMLMTGRERSEYERWKQEREQIDQDRLARHRNATGQWRREWDAQKTESMFKEACAAMQEQGETDSRREENKRPPKQPTFGDFLGQGKGREAGRGRGRGRDRNYSMHDNRWEEEVKGGEAEGKKEAGPPRNKDEAQKKAEDEGAPSQEADEDQWEDANDGEEGEEEEEKEKKPPQKQKKRPSLLTASKPLRSSTTQPRRKEGLRAGGDHPKQQLPPKQTTPEPPSPEPRKPLSPFSLADGYHPVSNWGEEMELQSPRGNLGELALGRPSSADPKPTPPESGPSCTKLLLGEDPEVGAESKAEPGEPERGRETRSPARDEGSSEEKLNSPADLQTEPEPAARSLVESENVSGGLETGVASEGLLETGREAQGPARDEGSSEEKLNSPADLQTEPEPAAQSLVESENVSGGLETGVASEGLLETGREAQGPARDEGSSEEKLNSPADPSTEPEPAARSLVESENVSGGLEVSGLSTSMPESEEEGEGAVELKLHSAAPDSQGTSDETEERENEPGSTETAAASQSEERLAAESDPSLERAPAVPEPQMDTPPSSEADPSSQVSNPQPDQDLELATESQTATG
ncbi:CCDC9 protein, partial [Polyodon spathula]|nr:CCDC9 protein [Polyodon spathula]